MEVWPSLKLLMVTWANDEDIVHVSPLRAPLCMYVPH